MTYMKNVWNAKHAPSPHAKAQTHDMLLAQKQNDWLYLTSDLIHTERNRFGHLEIVCI